LEFVSNQGSQPFFLHIKAANFFLVDLRFFLTFFFVSDAFGSPSNTSLVDRINNLEAQILDGKLVLLIDDGKPLPMQKEANVTSVYGPSFTIEMQGEDSDSDEVEDVYDDASHFMTSGGAYYASLHEDEDYDLYDIYDLQGLTPEQRAFCDAMDINLRV
jgi:hypothetical protein